MKFAIIGTGAIGGFYGGMLATAGCEVHFLLNSDYLHVKEKGLEIQSDIHGNFVVEDAKAYDKISSMPVCDVILVCLKTTQNRLLKEVGQLIHKNSLVIMIQNGLGVEEDAAAMLPGISIAGGLAFVGANKVGAGKIHHLEHGTLRIGGYNIKDRDLLDKTIDALLKAGIEAFYTDELSKLRWQKLIWNMAFNGTCTVFNTTTDVLLKNQDTRKLVYELMRETFEGAAACGIELDEKFIKENIALTDQMQPYKPSMRLDFDHKREMELKYIYEKPIEHAGRNGFEMKKTKVLLKQLQLLQNNYLLNANGI